MRRFPPADRIEFKCEISASRKCLVDWVFSATRILARYGLLRLTVWAAREFPVKRRYFRDGKYKSRRVRKHSDRRRPCVDGLVEMQHSYISSLGRASVCHGVRHGWSVFLRSPSPLASVCVLIGMIRECRTSWWARSLKHVLCGDWCLELDGERQTSRSAKVSLQLSEISRGSHRTTPDESGSKQEFGGWSERIA
jgi:hypothetical protein